MDFAQNTAAVVYLDLAGILSEGHPSLLITDVTIQLKKFGKPATALTLTSSNFRSAAGMYGVGELELSSADTDTVGPLIIQVQDTLIGVDFTLTSTHTITPQTPRRPSVAESQFMGSFATNSTPTIQVYLINSKGLPYYASEGPEVYDFEFLFMRDGVNTGTTLTWGGPVLDSPGMYYVTLPAEQTALTGNLDLLIRPTSHWSKLHTVTESLRDISVIYLDPPQDETYLLTVGGYTGDPVIYETYAYSTPTHDASGEALIPVGQYPTLCATKVVGDKVRVVVTNQGHFIVDKGEGAGWSLYNDVTSSSFSSGGSVAIYSANNIWAVSSSGIILFFNGTSTSTFSSTGKSYRECQIYGTELWIVGNSGGSPVCDKISPVTSSPTLTSVVSRFSLIESATSFNSITAEDYSGDMVVGGQDGLWKSTDNRVSFHKVALPSTYTSQGEEIDATYLNFYRCGTSGNGDLIISDPEKGVWFRSRNGNVWDHQEVYTSLRPPRISHGYAVHGTEIFINNYQSIDVSPVTLRLKIEDPTAPTDLTAITTALDDLATKMVRVLGLSQENVRITGQEYDGNLNLIGSTISTYPSSEDATAQTSPIAVYEMTASYDGNNRLVDYKFLRTV